MAAPVIPIGGVDLLLSAGGSPIGGERNATLNVTAETPSVAHKGSANFDETIAGARSWSVDAEGLYVEDAEELAAASAAVTIAGTALKGWDAMTLTLTCDLYDRLNKTSGLDTERAPKLRRAALEVSGAYYDPAGTGADALDDALAELNGTTSAGVAVAVTFGAAQSVSFTGRPTAASVSAPYDQDVQNSLSLGSTGAVTVVDTDVAAGLGALLDAWGATDVADAVTVLLATTTSGASQWTGSAFVAEIRLEFPYGEPVRVSVRLTGSGALTRGVTT